MKGALHAVDESLLSEWDAWSQTDERYRSGEPAGKWQTFRAAGGVGLGTLCHLADAADRSWRRVESQSPSPSTYAFTTAEWRPFPQSILPHPLGEYVARVAACINCDPSMVALPILSVLATAIGNTRVIQLKPGWQEPPVIWTAVVGASGTLKSPAIEAALRPLQQRQAAFFRDFEQAVAVWESECAEIKASKRGKPQELPPRPICGRLLVSDTTVEALAVRLQENPRGLLLYRDELAGWLNSFNAYKAGGKGSDSAHWLSMHGARNLLVDRKHGDNPTIHVARAAVSITGGIQPAILRQTLGREHFEDGLAARMLLAMPPAKPKTWTDAELTSRDAAPIDEIVGQLLRLHSGVDEDGESFPVVLPLTPSGRSEWIKFYNEHNEEQRGISNDDLRAAWSKLEAYVPRLALVVHLVRVSAGDEMVEHPDAVDGCSVLSGVALVAWFAQEVRRVYGMLGESDAGRSQRGLIDIIRRRGGRITPRDLTRTHTRQYPDTIAAEAALQALVAAKLGYWEVAPTTGRPRCDFILKSG